MKVELPKYLLKVLLYGRVGKIVTKDGIIDGKTFEFLVEEN